MDRAGEWSLSPAYDVTYSYNREGEFTARHQMSVNGKRDGFAIEDFERCGESVSMRRGRAAEIAAEVREAVAEWPSYAATAGVTAADAERIARTHRLELPRR
jgi:serine/threonine-protein kinase HipA